MSRRHMPDSEQRKAMIEKLPVWAKSYIQSLERRVEELKTDIATLSTPDSNIFWEKGISQDKGGIPQYATVTFITKHGEIDARLNHDGTLHISGDRLSVWPEASNAIEIRRWNYLKEQP